MRKADLDADPFRQFASWHEGVDDAAACLATASPDGLPGARMVLVRGYAPDGFRFFTNYSGAKARDLEANPRAALVWYWPPGRQVRADGRVERLTRRETAAYWETRPRGSQLGAWASRQSEVIGGREELEESLAEVRRRFGDGEVPCPPFWGGYRLVPDHVEFWHHRDDRLHDRLRYRREGAIWVIERLAP